jgi:hypothetical protein
MYSVLRLKTGVEFISMTNCSKNQHKAFHWFKLMARFRAYLNVSYIKCFVATWTVMRVGCATMPVVCTQ